MAIQLLQELIDKQDNWEIIRDQIAALLVAERDNQKTLAGVSSADYDFDVYLERTNPWEKWLNTDADNAPSLIPIVNVWVDTSSFDGLSSNTIERQTEDAVFNIDIYAIGVARDDGATGHITGDKAAAFERDRCVRLVRNILMSGTNTYLQLRGLVGKRWPNSIDFFQPEQDGAQVQQIAAARFALGVRFNEFSPQYVPVDLEIVGVELNYESKVIELQYNYPLP